MNMLWIWILLIFIIWEGKNSIKLKIYYRGYNNLITVTTSKDTQSTVTYSYTSERLKQIGTKLTQFHQLRRLPTPCLQTIKSLRINRRRIRIKNKQNPVHRINHDNLRYCYVDPSRVEVPTSKKLVIATLNARSVKNKIDLVQEFVQEYGVDVLLITETWLKDTEIDKIWLDATFLNQHPFEYYNLFRPDRRGGGILLLSRTEFKPKLVQESTLSSFEGATWKLIINNLPIHITRVYHPPPSTRNATTNSIFTDQLSDYMSNILTSATNNIVLGDFNIHVNDFNDVDAGYLIDTFSALGFSQYIDTATHTKGNTPDLIFSVQTQHTMIQVKPTEGASTRFLNM